MINERWCSDATRVSSFCSPDLETLIVKCRPYYSPREISTIFMIGVYIHPGANAKAAVRSLADQISSLENSNPDSTVLVLGDFNHANLRTVLPKYHQHVTCPTRGDKVLDHCYSVIPGAYRSVRRAPLGKSDHNMIYLVPVYKQKLKCVKPTTRTVKVWTNEAVEKLRACYDSTDWSIFRHAADSLDEHTDTVLSYIKFCEDLLIPTKTIKIFSNNKPWFTRSVKERLKEKDEAYKSGDLVAFKRAKYTLDKELRCAKLEYRNKLEEQFCSGNSREVWQGLESITNYKMKSHKFNDDPSLPDQLNEFYARFDRENTSPVVTTSGVTDELPPPFVIEEESVRKALACQNTRKAAGPDGISNSTLRHCADQLAPALTCIFNESLQTGIVPKCFKSAVIIPVPKKSKVSTLNDYRPVALTPVVMKVFERLVLGFLKSVTDHLLDPMQFAYRANRSVEDAVSLTLHYVLQHLEKSRSYARILFLDFSSAFNTIIPQKLSMKLCDLNLNPLTCKWILSFLTERTQVVKCNGRLSSSLTLNTGAPQGCCLSPFLFTLFTNDCVSNHNSVLVVKFSDDTTVSGLITDADESVYRGEVERLVGWCDANNLMLNVSKTKELVVDFRSNKTSIRPLDINGQIVEIVQSFRFLGSIMASSLKWEDNVTTIRKKAQQRLYFLRQLRKFKVSQQVLLQFYRAAIESVLTFSISTWYGSTSHQERNELDRIVDTASKIIGCHVPSLQVIYEKRLLRRASHIVSDLHHPANHLFQQLPSGKRYRAIKTRTERFRSSFYPRAVLALSPTFPSL